MTLPDKQKEIESITAQQIALLKKSIALTKRPPCKTIVGSILRADKIVQYLIQARMLAQQKRIVLSQSIPKFPKGTFE